MHLLFVNTSKVSRPEGTTEFPSTTFTPEPVTVTVEVDRQPIIFVIVISLAVFVTLFSFTALKLWLRRKKAPVEQSEVFLRTVSRSYSPYTRGNSGESLKRMGESFSVYGHVFDKEQILFAFRNWFNKNYKSSKMVRLYIGEKKCGTFRSNEKVIVLVIDDVKIIKEKIFNHSGKSYPIVCKLFKFPSQEGEKVASKEQDIEFDETFYIDSRNCIRNHSRSLFQKHSNLEMIGASAYRSKKNGCDIVPEPCIVFYCSCKGVKPLEESNFPTTVNGIKTDVREGFFYQSTNEVYSAKSEEDIYPLLTGASISSKDSSIMGTLGGFVKSSNGDIGFITCAHVLFNLSKKCYETEMFDIVQPAYSNNICGVHTYSCFPTTPFPDCTMDASLVILKSRKPEKGLFSNLTAEDFCLLGNGLSKENLPEYSEGDNVRDYDQMQDHGNHLKDPCFKLGAKSGFTKGYLRFNEISVRCYSDEMDVSHSSTPLEIKYYSQLEIKGSDKDFADAGDSGAFVYQLDSSSTKEDKHRLYCIGMIVGNTNFSTVVTPIVPILQTFGAEMYTFPQDKS